MCMYVYSLPNTWNHLRGRLDGRTCFALLRRSCMAMHDLVIKAIIGQLKLYLMPNNEQQCSSWETLSNLYM